MFIIGVQVGGQKERQPYDSIKNTFIVRALKILQQTT